MQIDSLHFTYHSLHFHALSSRGHYSERRRARASNGALGSELLVRGKGIKAPEAERLWKICTRFITHCIAFMSYYFRDCCNATKLL